MRALLYFACLLQSCQYALIMPSVWEYLRVDLHAPSKPLLGVVIAAFTLVRTLFAPLIGCWSDRRGFREPLLFCCLVGVAGGCMYGLAGRTHSLLLAVGGRCLGGLAGTQTTLVSAYIARTVPDAKLTNALALSRASFMLGNVLGPALNVALVPLDRLHSTLLSSKSAAGWLPAVFNVVLLLCFASRRCFRNIGGATTRRRAVGRTPLLNADALAPPAAGDEAPPRPAAQGSTSTATPDLAVPPSAQDAALRLPEPSATKPREYASLLCHEGGWFALLTSLLLGLQFTALDSAATPITHESFAWGTLENSALFGGLAAVAFGTILCTRVLSARGGRRPAAARELPRALACVGMSLMGAGYGVALAFCRGHASRVQLPLWVLLTACGLLVCGYITLSPAVNAIYAAKAPRARKGEMLAINDSCNGVGRIVGPVLSTAMLHVGGVRLAFAVIGGIWLVSLLAMACVFDKLRLPDRLESRSGVSG